MQILVPVYLFYRIWSTHFSTQLEWGLSAVYLMTILGFWFVIGRWDVTGYGFRYWGYALLGAGAICSYQRVMDRPVISDQINWHCWKVLEILLVIAIIVGAVRGYYPNVKGVELGFPLKGRSFYVVQGGAFPLINYHGLAAHSQKFALDINQLNSWGFRGASLMPENPNNYRIFGVRVVSPVSGTIISETDSMPDQSPPHMKPEHAAGNHIWIRHEDLYILLAHLKQGSISVKAGQHIEEGEPLARVGNTGNTSEPHLHIHAVRISSDALDRADKKLLGKGEPVPIRLRDEFFVRNEVFSSSQVKQSGR